MSKQNPYDALVRRLEMTLSRQRLAITETELQIEAAKEMQRQQLLALEGKPPAKK